VRVWPGAPPREMPPFVTHGDILRWLERGLPRSDAIVQELLEALNMMVATVPTPQAMSFDPLEEAYEAMQVLKARLPFLIDKGREHNRQHLADAFQHLLSAVESADRLIEVPGKREHKAQLWHDDAMWLVYILRITAGPAEVKISSSGPGVRFLQKALGHVWKKEFTGDQVRKAVARYDHGRIPELVIVPQ
jgi:hypothetical protein